MTTTHPFDIALAGMATRLQLADGRTVALDPARWHGSPGRADRWLLSRCHGPTIDLGCGPGRLVAALISRSVAALGVDASPRAIRQCASRGAPVVQRDVFAPLPDEGRWRHALLADGNIGIGGDPVRLLRRAAALLRVGGSVLIESAAPGTGFWRGAARVPEDDASGAWFPWAVVGLESFAQLGNAAGLPLARTHRVGRRYFAELVKPPTGNISSQSGSARVAA